MHEKNKTPPFLLLPWSAAVAHQVAEDDEGRKPYVLRIWVTMPAERARRGAAAPRSAAAFLGAFSHAFSPPQIFSGVQLYYAPEPSANGAKKAQHFPALKPFAPGDPPPTFIRTYSCTDQQP